MSGTSSKTGQVQFLKAEFNGIAKRDHFPGLEAMAATLEIRPRTLRRKLEAQQTTYHQIVAEIE